MRILHVEDNAHDADLTHRALERTMPGVVLRSVPSLAEAWRVLASDAVFDLLLADLHLTDGSGLELIAGVRGRDMPMAVVMLTGSGDERSAVAALKAGADDYMVKRGDYLRELPAVIESAVAYKAGQARRSRPIRVLYAEHNVMDVDITRRHLGRHAPHIRLEAVSTGEQALAKLRQGERYDVLLLDYRLGGLNALELLKALRDEDGLPLLPVVLVTGHGDELIAVQALRLGAADYLVKRSGYLHELTSVLENAHHRAELAREQHAHHLSESAHRLSEKALASISQGVVVTDSARRIIYANTAFFHITGYAESEVLGNNCSFMQGELTDAETVRQMRIALDAGNAFSATLANYRRDGALFWNNLSLAPVLDASGALTHYVGVINDVTAQRQLEEQFRQAQKMEAIGQLSGGVAHDFNNLLTVIHGHLGLLEATGRIVPEIVDSIHEISQAATRAANLTRQLLTFSRKQVMQSRDLDLREVVDNMARMLTRIVGEHIRMVVEKCDAPAWVRADQGMMEQVLMNLSINARDAMPDGGRLLIKVDHIAPEECPVAHFESNGEGGKAKPTAYVRLTVADTGCGISPEIRDKIFEPFFTTKEVGKGTGLGLATVYGIARQHGGICALDSEVGHGTRFFVVLPALDSPEADAGTAAGPGGGMRGGGETILLVEDDPSVASLVRMALEMVGYRVLEASSGVRALELWRSHAAEVQLLFTDFVMPDGMTGRELANRLLAERPDLPVIFTSGYTPDMAGKELNDGSAVRSHFLAKPFSCSSLLEMVRQGLDAGATAKRLP